MVTDRQRLVARLILLWVVVIIIFVLVWIYIVQPRRAKNLVSATSAKSQYRTEVTWLGDSFSGYAIFRSQSFLNALAKQGIRFIYKPVPDYVERIEMLADQKAQFGVFPIGTYITVGARAGNKYPASQILNIDETVGADAIVAFKTAVPNIDSLNNAQGKICLTPNSPSETLAQVMVAQWALDMLSAKWACHRDGADLVYRDMMSADRSLSRAYVLWEPFVTMARTDPEVIVLFDSGQCQGCILDGLYAERTFLGKNTDTAKKIVEAYLRALYYYSQENRLVELIVTDAAEQGQKISREQAEKIVTGIRWTNTRENYAYFGIERADAIKTLEDNIRFLIEQVLLPTNALSLHPLPGKENTLYYDGILRSLYADNFHPAKTVNIVPGVGPETKDLAEVRGSITLPTLTEQQWQQLAPAGSKRISPIEFRRGSSEISEFSQTDIETAAKELQVLANFYIIVRGQAIGEDNESNRELARARASAVMTALQTAGITENRLRALTATNTHGDSQACVTLELAQSPY